MNYELISIIGMILMSIVLAYFFMTHQEVSTAEILQKNVTIF